MYFVKHNWAEFPFSWGEVMDKTYDPERGIWAILVRGKTSAGRMEWQSWFSNDLVE